MGKSRVEAFSGGVIAIIITTCSMRRRPCRRHPVGEFASAVLAVACRLSAIAAAFFIRRCRWVYALVALAWLVPILASNGR